MTKNVILLLLCCMFASQVFAIESGNAENLDGAHRYEERIEGLVLDQTITPQGHEFYRTFVSALREQGDETHGNFVVYERPAVRSASLLWIEYRFRKVYSGFARANRRGVLEGMGTTAAQAARQRVTEIEIEALAKNQDMASDEI